MQKFHIKCPIKPYKLRKQICLIKKIIFPAHSNHLQGKLELDSTIQYFYNIIKKERTASCQNLNS